ncbi:uncharacterized protein BDR25DRAFT_376125 [Lindgomyces ingoldianus]|uniref:Uncharacterized protein n=1 Tax=Lindgomyces ingoldianus TaxID=673940 RepID=A0ACB6QJY0_9PLEO|nr:uncharacterized protein BDR25DRAFT_376125 [Lindgomyces ingoldianus]KAF2467236.1 hypothetical protein BDR25DRAFT_376125 [Lindgomyces ingoldianus]
MFTTEMAELTDTSPSNASELSTGTSITPPVEIFARPPIKRARPQLSCTPCRQGKLKCNREHPVCDQCSKRSRHESCKYVPPPPRNKQAQNMRGRIRNLETLVVNLINQKTHEQGDTLVNERNRSCKTEVEVNREPEIDSFGQLRISHAGTETSYVGAGHWSSILKEIEEVKDSLEDSEGEDDANEEVWDDISARSTVTFGIPRPVTKAMLIQEMPSKDDVDRLLPLWFNSADPLLYIIHAPTFQEEYRQFWKDSSSTPVMWIALLYSAMALGIILGPRNPGLHAHAAAYDRSSGSLFDKNDNLASAADRYQQLASSAMVLADIAKSQPYTLETLMIYGECEFLRRDDHHSKIFLMNGVVVRVAMRMGYHRDPSNFKGMSPFQGEMRRRVWHVLNMMDSLIAFAVGLPSMIRRVESDVRAPRNLYDTDLSINMTELPKDRPKTEITPGLYTISKSRVCAVFAEAAELSQKCIPPRHSTILALDKRLEEAHDLVPEGMRVRPMGQCITDPPVLIMSRFNIELLYQKTRVVLHRNYLTAGQSDPRFADSRKTCVDASLEILRYQNIVFQACRPGGQLQKVWWYMSSLSTYDFLLAAMVVCLELNHLRNIESSPDFEGTPTTRIAEMLGILENTYEIWANHPNRFRESIRGAEMVQAMLKKCSGPAGPRITLQNPIPNGMEQNIAELPPGFTPSMAAEELPPQIWGTWPPPPEASSLDMPGIPSEIDWTLWDSTMQEQQNMLPASNNTAMDMWMSSMTSNVNSRIDNMLDFSDPLNLHGFPTFYAPPPDM